MARILLLDPDEPTKRVMFESLRSLDGHKVYVKNEMELKGQDGGAQGSIGSMSSSTIHEIYAIPHMRNILDILAEKAFDIIFIDDKLVGGAFEEWLKKLRADCP